MLSLISTLALLPSSALLYFSWGQIFLTLGLTLTDWWHNLTGRHRCGVQLGVLELGHSLGLGVGLGGAPPRHGQLPGEGDGVGGGGQTDAHQPRQSDVTVQSDHRDIIDRTHSGARPLPVARVDLDMRWPEVRSSETEWHSLLSSQCWPCYPPPPSQWCRSVRSWRPPSHWSSPPPGCWRSSGRHWGRGGWRRGPRHRSSPGTSGVCRRRRPWRETVPRLLYSSWLPGRRWGRSPRPHTSPSLLSSLVPVLSDFSLLQAVSLVSSLIWSLLCCSPNFGLKKKIFFQLCS